MMLWSDMIIVKEDGLKSQCCKIMLDGPTTVKQSLESNLYFVGFCANIEVTMCHQFIHRGIMIDTVNYVNTCFNYNIHVVYNYYLS